MTQLIIGVDCATKPSRTGLARAERTGKTPLDVGADRIARTAHSALLFLDHVGKATAEAIPLAWDIPLKARIEAIEVYPAATMLVRGGSLRGYKKREAESARGLLLESLVSACDFTEVRSAAVENHDCLDALACVVAGIDFLEGKVVKPKHLDVARREGWIWFRDPR